MTPSDAHQRVPALALVDDPDLRQAAADEVAQLPDYFWSAPATSSDEYHNQFARGEHGLWIHTLMVATALERTIDSYVDRGAFDEYDADCARVAAILHDGRKYGDRWRPGKSAAGDHDLQMADYIRDYTELPETVAGCVAAHMGPWYAGPPPKDAVERAVHTADLTGSARHVTPAVYDPPARLVDAHPDLPRCHSDADAPRREGRQLSLGGGGE
jgi:HD domain.